MRIEVSGTDYLTTIILSDFDRRSTWIIQILCSSCKFGDGFEIRPHRLKRPHRFQLSDECLRLARKQPFDHGDEVFERQRRVIGVE